MRRSWRSGGGDATRRRGALDLDRGFRDNGSGKCHVRPMARPSESQAEPLAGAVSVSIPRVVQADPGLEQELLRAMEDFDRGDYIELTVEQLEHCAATGESPWPDESHG